MVISHWMVTKWIVQWSQHCDISYLTFAALPQTSPFSLISVPFPLQRGMPTMWTGHLRRTQGLFFSQICRLNKNKQLQLIILKGPFKVWTTDPPCGSKRQAFFACMSFLFAFRLMFQEWPASAERMLQFLKTSPSRVPASRRSTVSSSMKVDVSSLSTEWICITARALNEIAVVSFHDGQLWSKFLTQFTRVHRAGPWPVYSTGLLKKKKNTEPSENKLA